MLHYIVPPIIIVVSSAILIIFLFKKFSKSENIDPSVLENLNGNGSTVGLGAKTVSFFSHLWLRILEKMMQRMKLLSLKMHNTSNNWFHSIKSKREKSGQAIAVMEDVEKEIEKLQVEKKASKREIDVPKKSVESVERKVGFFKMKRPNMEKISTTGEMFSRRNRMFLKREEPKEEQKIVEKSGMEEDLIKRIAVNPKDIEAYERLGDYYPDMKNFRDSIECYKQVLKLSPDHSKARAKMKNLEIMLKK